MTLTKNQFAFFASALFITSLLGACQTPATNQLDNNLMVNIDRSDVFYLQEIKKFWRVHIQSGESGVAQAINGCYLNTTQTTSLQYLYRCLVLDVTLTNFSLSFGKAVGEKFGRGSQDLTSVFTYKENMQERAYQAFNKHGVDKQTLNNEVDFISKKVSPIFASTYTEVDAELSLEKKSMPLEKDWGTERHKQPNETPIKPTVADENLNVEQELLSSLPDHTRKEVAYQLLLSKVSNAKQNDYAAALQLSRMAADDGSYTAQYNMGVFHQQGYGVLQDNKEALRWFMKSAEQGYPMAFASLAEFYVVGNGVEKSQTVAYALLSVAASYAKTTKGNIEIIRDLRNQIAKELSPHELIAAQSLSKELIKKNNVEKSIKSFIAIK